jgi:transposase-like protein
MSVLTRPYFHDEEAAFAHLESVLWPNGPVCPHCGVVSTKHYDLRKSRLGLRKCCTKECRKQFTVRVGTVFESSHIPLHKVLQAVYLMSSSKKGISAHQLHRTLEVTYKAAWFLAHRIREAMRDDDPEPLGGKGKTVEIDETFIGKPEQVFVSGKGWQSKRGTATKQKVLTMVERGGRAISVKVDDLTVPTIKRILGENVVLDSTLNTDEAQHYKQPGAAFEAHEAVNHGNEEYVRKEGENIVTTNTVEGFFGIFKRGMKGVYQHCAEHHLQRYLCEFDFQYSNRSGLGVEDFERCERALLGLTGKRLTYRGPHNSTTGR